MSARSLREVVLKPYEYPRRQGGIFKLEHLKWNLNGRCWGTRTRSFSKFDCCGLTEPWDREIQWNLEMVRPWSDRCFEAWRCCNLQSGSEPFEELTHGMRGEIKMTLTGMELAYSRVAVHSYRLEGHQWLTSTTRCTLPHEYGPGLSIPWGQWRGQHQMTSRNNVDN
jgi:hypothetical protein